jgi:proteasome lid subunit RPN8/RPN11
MPQALVDAMIAQAQADLPNECCGLLAGHLVDEKKRGIVVERFPLTNTAASPTRYEADPRGLIRAFIAMRDRGLDHLAIYHSHPTSDPVPSRTDHEWAFYPDVHYFIMSLKGPQPVMRSWWLSEAGFMPAEWRIAGAE